MKIKILLLLLLTSMPNFSQEKYEVFFDFNKDIPNAKSEKAFHQWLTENPKIEIIKMHGFCDSVDDNNYNKELSEKRISNILKILKDKKIKLSPTIELKSFGKNFKQAKNQDLNRKVVVFFKLEKVKAANVISNEEVASNVDLNAIIAEEKESLSSKFKKAKKGETIKIEHIYFFRNSEKIISKSMPLLEELYSILKKNPKLKIEIHGHICCNTNVNDTKLSYRRALYIFSYLLEKEILLNRLSYKGFGSARPVYKIPEKTEAERLANRRVEILIVEK